MGDREKLDNQAVADIIDNEGIGYAIQSYLSADDIEDPELARMWGLARAALDDIEAYLVEYMEEGE